MTDTHFDIGTVEEVKTNPIIDVLRLPFNAEIAAKVTRFGFEYEMFPSGYDQGEIHVDADDVWSRNHDPCNCESCIDERIEDRIQELLDEGHGGRSQLSSIAESLGLVNDADRHEYHCGCDDCDYGRSGPLMTTQSDCSCGIEFVSRIIDLNDFDEANRDINAWVGMMQNWKDDGKWMPNGTTSNGNHVHVSHESFAYDTNCVAHRHINALYAAFDWTEVADGGCGQIRGYNAKPHQHNGDGNWCSFRDETFEHRLWNTPCIPQRLWVHLGLSIAITRWAEAIAKAYPTFTFWVASNDRYYIPRMSDQTYNLIHNLRESVIQGIRQYIPDNACFDEARQLILNLS